MVKISTKKIKTYEAWLDRLPTFLFHKIAKNSINVRKVPFLFTEILTCTAPFASPNVIFGNYIF